MYKEDIIKNLIDEDGNIIKSRLTEKYLKKHNYYDFLINYYNDSESIKETIYRIINNIDIRPTCAECGGRVRFDRGLFSTFCCPKCRNNNEEVKIKNKIGVSKSLKKAYEKRGEEIKQKRKETLLSNYNEEVSSPFALQVVKNKIKNTLLNKYGVDNILKLKDFRKTLETSQKHSIQLQKEYGYDIEYVLNNYGEYDIKVKNGCEIHGDIIINASLFNNRTKKERKNYTTLCPICNPIKNPETNIETQIKKILNELNIDYCQHYRELTSPYELDFYIPSYNIAIECNGIYWHNGKDNLKRHLLKKKICEEKGIRLLYFWEDQIIYKINIIKDILKSVFNLNNKIYARKCVIKEISSNIAKEFINENHLQGNVNASIRYGLYYNNMLIQVMTFGKLRKCLNQTSEDNIYELYRFCTKGGYNVIGGASKLLNFFIKNNKPKKIITYCSKDISQGNVYKKIGFSFAYECGSGYDYVNIKTYERKNRYTLRKDKVDDHSGRTADEILLEKNWVKCYNLGNFKYEIIC